MSRSKERWHPDNGISLLKQQPGAEAKNSTGTSRYESGDTSGARCVEQVVPKKRQKLQNNNLYKIYKYRLFFVEQMDGYG